MKTVATFIVVLLVLIAPSSLFAQCNGNCDELNSSDLPESIEKDFCVNQVTTYVGDFVINGGSLTVYDGDTLTIIGSLTLNYGEINLCECGVLKIQGTFINNAEISDFTGYCSNCDYLFWVNGATRPEALTCESPMPISLFNFNTSFEDRMVRIEWSTLSELNNESFFIERSSDAMTWEVVSEIAGSGTTNEQVDYFATDDSPLSGTSYYRIRQTDYNGSITYSDISTVINPVEVKPLTVYPNPAGEQVFIDLSSDQSAIVEIYSSMGQKMQVKQSLSNDILSIDSSNLSDGLYYVHISGVNGETSRSIIIDN